jgi:type III restriction enzyme
MKDKERLLSFPDGKDAGRNVAFIFAHSALKEGWDNPNVFQICTLNQTTSSLKKRQEIGRGLRLCVDQEGNRSEAEGINILTVIANESYESYVDNLQKNYIDDGEVPTPKPKKQKDSEAKRQKDPYESKAFRDFWRRLCQRLTYTIEIDTPALITACVRRLNRASFPAPVLTISKGRFVVVEYAIRVEREVGDRVELRIEERSNQGVPNPLAIQAPDHQEAVVKVGDDLAKLKGNKQLRGFKVVKIWSQYGEVRVRFANDIEVSASEVHRFQATRVDDARVTEQAMVASTQPVPDFIGRAADETHLTRSTLTEIFVGLSGDARTHLPRNPEGWSNVFVREIKEVLADHIAERLQYVDTREVFSDPENPDDLFPESVKAPQKEHVAGSAWSLYDKVQVDSEVEKRFVNERLHTDDSVRLYFKFPPRFKIDLPRVIGDYNPDWGVVRIQPEGGFTIELVRETKGNEDLSKLRFPNEVRKIRLAQRYFEQLGIDYRAVSPETEAPLESDRERVRRKPVQLRLAPRSLTPAGYRPVPVYDLKIAAGRFSAGQEPEVIQHALLPESVAFRPGLFIAQVVGDSMERVAADGRWCLWEHLGMVGVGQLATGLHFVFKRSGHPDPDLGEFTFKSYRRGADGRPVLHPMSYNPAHRDLEVDEENPPVPIARFIQVLRDEDLPTFEATAP